MTNVLNATVKIGKAGITDKIIYEIAAQLKKKKLIKIRLARGILIDNDKKAIAQDIAKKTGAEMIKMVGFTIILKKKI